MGDSHGRSALRSALASSQCWFPASVFDPLSARIAEQLGFQFGMLAGSTASLTVLGAPDLALLTLSELAEQARRICRATSLPLIVDADHGYGNALNVRRSVEELEAAGVAGLTIEDTLLPLPGRGGDALIPLEEGLGKVEAALDARSDPDLVILARTHAGIQGVSEAVRRCEAYSKAGADAVFVTGVEMLEDLEAIARVVDVPIMLGAVAKDIRASPRLPALGVRLALLGHGAMMRSVAALYEAMAAQAREVGCHAQDEAVLGSEQLMRVLTRADLYRSWREAFVR